MSLIVETGAGVSNAESYCSVADADAYHTRFGAPAAWSGASTGAKETALRTATRFLEASVAGGWDGDRVTDTQALGWPRYDAEVDGAWVLSTIVPQAVKDATAVLALAALSEDLMPDISEPGIIASESITVGEISSSTSYQGGKSQAKSYRLAFSLIAPLCGSGGRMERF